MNLNRFIEYWSSDDGPIGDLAKDLMGLEQYPFKESDIEVLHAIESEANRVGLTKSFENFRNLYENQKV